MNKIIKELKEALNTNTETKAYDTQAEVVRVEGQTLWVHIPGGVDETPVKKTINAKAGDTVQVRVGGGSAWLVGNQSAPPTDDTTAIIADRKASEVRGIAIEAQEVADDAFATADSAMQSANGKNTIYYGASAPTGGTYKTGDTWFNSSEDNAIYMWNGASWTKEELGEDAIANLSITNAKIANGTIQNGKIANLDAGKITAGNLSADVMKTNAVSAINATVDKIDAKNVKVAQIEVGDLSDGSDYSTTSQMNTAISDSVERAVNILLDADAPSITKVNANYNRYFSDSGNSSYVTCSIEPLSDPPEKGINYAYRAVGNGTNTSTVARALVFYNVANTTEIPLKVGTMYTVSFWGRCTNGTAQTYVNYRYKGTTSRNALESIVTLTSEWKLYTGTIQLESMPTDYNRVWFYIRFLANTAGTAELCGFKITSGASVSTYITKIDNGGIKVHDAGDTSNYSKIDSTGMQVYQNNNEVAKFGTSSRIGDASSDRIEISSAGIEMYVSSYPSPYKAFSINEDELQFSTGYCSIDLGDEDGSIITSSSGGHAGIEMRTGDLLPNGLILNSNNYVYCGDNFGPLDTSTSTSTGYYLGWTQYRWRQLYAYSAENIVSDRKHKDVIGDIDFAKELIMGLEPVEFQWKDSDHKRSHMGFIAQDSAEVAKGLGKDLSFYEAHYQDGSDYHGEDADDKDLSWGMMYSELIAPLVKVVQQQQKEIDELKSIVAELAKEKK